jgi:hypothetical protein
MQINSGIAEIKRIENPNTEYIESELNKIGITPLRWAIVKISKDFFTINYAYDKITEDECV